MKLQLPFTNLSKRFKRRPANSRVVFAHWDRETIDFLVVTPNSRALSPQDIGSVPRADHANPLKALAEYFEQQKITVGRLVVLLSRPELDQLQLDLPPAERQELPALVASAIEEQLGEADEPPRVDYLTPLGQEPSEAARVLAFALSANALHALQTQCESSGFRLAALGSRHLSPLGVLNRRSLARDALTVSIHVYAAEVEMVVCHHATPLLLRSIRINPDEPTRIGEQIWLETQRCLTLLPEELNAQPISWCVFTTSEFAWQVSQALEDRGLSVQTIDPLLGWDMSSRLADADKDEGGPVADATQLNGSSAANAGAAWAFVHDGLPVNLLDPKQAPAPPNLYLRWGSLAAAAVLVLAVGVGFLLSDVRGLEGEVADLEQQLTDAKKIAAKYQSKADQVAFVEGWLADQVDWLSELEQLSQRLPQGQNATVRRLSGGVVDRTAVFDLSVQVAEPEHISALEEGVRSAKYSTSSKSINQKADESEYPWQFETRVTFAVDPPDPKNYGPKKADQSSEGVAADVAVSTAASTPSTTNALAEDRR